MATTWPDTTHVPCPHPMPPAIGKWLLGRHPELAATLEQIPGAIDTWPGEIGPAPDLDLLGDAFYELYQGRGAGRPTPSPVSRAATALEGMSQRQRAQIRLLATFGFTSVVLHVSDLHPTGDTAYERLVADWWTAVRYPRPVTA